MSSLALEVEDTMRHLDVTTAAKLERLVRDALALVRPGGSSELPSQDRHQAWLNRLNRLRGSIGTGKVGTSTEDILDDLRSGR